MKKNWIALLLLLAVMLSLSACGEKKDPEPTATPEVSAAP